MTINTKRGDCVINSWHHCTFDFFFLFHHQKFHSLLFYYRSGNKKATVATNMSSYFEYYGRLRTVTMEAWERVRSGHSTFEERMSFWMKYLYDVVPEGVVPCHVPSNNQMADLHPADYPIVRRLEIQLRCMEGILMTGLVSMDRYSRHIEEITASVAYDHWRDGLVVYDHRQAWGMFTCLETIKFYVSRNGRDYRYVSTVHPIDNAREVARYIQREYDRIRVR